MTDQGRAVQPSAGLTAALRIFADGIRAREVTRAERKLRGLTRTERELVEAVTNNVVVALLREPTARVNAAAGAVRARYVEVIRHLFALDEEELDDAP